MFSQSKIKYVQSLHQKKFRQKYTKFLVEGTKIASEVLNEKLVPIEIIFATESWIADHKPSLKSIAYETVSVAELKKISCLETPNQVLIVLEKPKININYSQTCDTISLYLDGIQDPGNNGTILSIADWFGIKNIFCSPDTVDFQSPKVIQASMGSFLRVQTIEISLTELKNLMPNTPVFGAVLDGEATNVFDLSKQEKERGIIVIGNEGGGIRSHNLAHISNPIFIEKHLGSKAESLNAAIATSIICAIFRSK